MADGDFAVFRSGRGGKDSPEQQRLDEAIRGLVASHGCRSVRSGGGGFPSWEIKIGEADGIRATRIAAYDPSGRRIDLFDARGQAVADALLKLLQSSFGVTDARIVRRGQA